MLKLLKSPNWFLDATFKVAARGYQQLLIIIVYHPLFGTYLPAAYVLMGSKTYDSYIFALSNLKLLCEALGVKPDPTYVMCDFEAGMRKAIRKYYPETTITGCYFHYCKALWHYAATHSLTTKEKLYDTILMITFFKLFALIPIEERQELFNDLFVMYKTRDKAFNDLLTYFKKN